MRQAKWVASIAILVTGAAAVAASDPGYDRVAGRAHASRSEIIAPHAMAATSQPLATQVAIASRVNKAAFSRSWSVTGLARISAINSCVRLIDIPI